MKIRRHCLEWRYTPLRFARLAQRGYHQPWNEWVLRLLRPDRNLSYRYMHLVHSSQSVGGLSTLEALLLWFRTSGGVIRCTLDGRTLSVSSMHDAIYRANACLRFHWKWHMIWRDFVVLGGAMPFASDHPDRHWRLQCQSWPIPWRQFMTELTVAHRCNFARLDHSCLRFKYELHFFFGNEMMRISPLFLVLVERRMFVLTQVVILSRRQRWAPHRWQVYKVDEGNIWLHGLEAWATSTQWISHQCYWSLNISCNVPSPQCPNSTQQQHGSIIRCNLEHCRWSFLTVFILESNALWNLWYSECTQKGTRHYGSMFLDSLLIPFTWYKSL